MTQVNKEFVRFKGANEIPTVESPDGNGFFFYYRQMGQMEKLPLSYMFGLMSSGFQFSINPSTPEPSGGWVKGVYPAEISGSYANQLDSEDNPITVDLNNGYTLLLFDGSNWSKIEVPNGISPIDVLDLFSNKPVNSKAVIEEFKNTYMLGEFHEYTDSGIGGQSIVPNYSPTEDIIVTDVSGIFNSSGILRLVVLKNKRPDPVVSGSFLFDKVSTNDVNIVSSGYNNIKLTNPITIKTGEWYAVDKNSTSQPLFAPGNASGKSAIQCTITSDGAYGSSTDGLDLSILLTQIKDKYSLSPTIVNITASRNEADYNSIREIMASISDASEGKRYVINIPEGTWRECDIIGKKYVKLKGAGRKRTLLVNDSSGTMAELYTPSDYSFPSEANKKLSLIARDLKHVINARADVDIEDLTLDATDCKYALHLDDGSWHVAIAKNVAFTEVDCNYPIGIGISGGQSITITQCFIERKISGNLGVFVHNWNNQTKGSVVTFDRCKFSNCNYLLIDELGSEQNDELNLWNCMTTENSGEGYLEFMVDRIPDLNSTFWYNGDGIREPNPVNVPYCWCVNTTGTKIGNMSSHNGGNFNLAWSAIPQRNLDTVKTNSIILEI